MQKLMPTPSPNKRVPKSKFTPLEDQLLKQLVSSSDVPNWSQIALCMRTKNARQCRERWQNYLSPNIREVTWTAHEDQTLMEKYFIAGPKWSLISKYFNGKSANTVRNRFLQLVRNQNRKIMSFDGITPQLIPNQTSVIEMLQFRQNSEKYNIQIKPIKTLSQITCLTDSNTFQDNKDIEFANSNVFSLFDDFSDIYDVAAEFLE